MLLSKLNDNNARKLYAQESLENAWSSSVLNHRVDMRYIEREGKGVTDFAETMPPANYDMPAQVFKYPYLFDFIGTAETMREVEVERPLVVHMVKLGQGFAFVGRQVHLAVGGDDFFIRLYYKRFFWLSKLVPQGGFAFRPSTPVSGLQAASALPARPAPHTMDQGSRLGIVSGALRFKSSVY